MTRSDGTFMGWYFVERVQLRHTYLSLQGIGRRQEFTIQMVQDPNGGSAAAASQLLHRVISIMT